MAAAVVLFAGLVVGTFGYGIVRRYAPDAVANHALGLALTVALSALAPSSSCSRRTTA